MMFFTSVSLARESFDGVGYFLNRAGVTEPTCESVVWADSMVPITVLNGSLRRAHGARPRG